MKKKDYINPRIEEHRIDTMSLMAGSGEGVQNTDKGIEYGGIDTSGDKDPAAKYDMWVAEFPSAWEE